MALNQCPQCAETVGLSQRICISCGARIDSASVPPINTFSGKLSAVGVLCLAIGLIATVFTMWWGPALLFPAAAFLMMSKFL